MEVGFVLGIERKGGLGKFYLYVFWFLQLILICNESLLRRPRNKSNVVP